MNRPEIVPALELCVSSGLHIDPQTASYFISREKIVSNKNSSGLAAWRTLVFAAMIRNAGSVTDFFSIPPGRVVELGTVIEF
jgi:KUP system potassium uptake protein